MRTLRTRRDRVVSFIAPSLAAMAALVAPTDALLAAPSVQVPLTGVSITNGVSSAANTRSSAPAALDPALRYRFQISGNVRGTPLNSILGLLYFSPTPVVNIITAFGGTPDDLTGVFGNPTGGFPAGPTTVTYAAAATIGSTPATISFDLTGQFSADGVATFTIGNVAITPTNLGGLVFTSGQTTISAITCIADLNFDNVVDNADFVLFVESYNEFVVPQPQTLGDFDGDGFCDNTDFVLFAGAFTDFLCP